MTLGHDMRWAYTTTPESTLPTITGTDRLWHECSGRQIHHSQVIHTKSWKQSALQLDSTRTTTRATVNTDIEFCVTVVASCPASHYTRWISHRGSSIQASLKTLLTKLFLLKAKTKAY